VPGTLEFAEVEERISRMTDSELVEMHDHPDDYEPWALDLGRTELARRRIAPERVHQLRAENAADVAAAERPAEQIATAYFMHHVWVLVGVFAFPLLFAIAHHKSRNGDRRTAIMLRIIGVCAALFWAGLTARILWPGSFGD